MAVGRYFNVGPLTLPEWKHALGTDVQKSTDPKAIVAYLTSLGMSVDARQPMTLDDLSAATAAGKPVIVCCQDYGPEVPRGAEFAYGHYLTVIGRGMGYIFVQDSSADNVVGNSGSDEAPGRVMIRDADFDKLWHDRDEAGNQYDHWGVVVGPTETVA